MACYWIINFEESFIYVGCFLLELATDCDDLCLIMDFLSARAKLLLVAPDEEEVGEKEAPFILL